MSISERTPLADYMNLIILQLPSQLISLTLSMQNSKYTTYLSQVTDKHYTLTLKYSNSPVVLSTPLEDGWDIYWYPTKLCYVSLLYFLCLCDVSLFIKVIKQTS